MTNRRISVWRCPECGSTKAGPDESRSRYELTFMTCPSCRNEGLVDSYERDADWCVDLDLDLDANADADSVPEFLPPLDPSKAWYAVVGPPSTPSPRRPPHG
jgi:predicted RNA-binding Zn-ribbon protein involved in translation (DUF1610 family)